MADSTRRRPECRSLGEDKDRAKALPGARWDAGLKCWRVPMAFRLEATALVEELNGGVDSTLLAALIAVLRGLPVELRQPTYKALVKLWHPDTGGDTRITKALTAAWIEVSR
jgi:hypothetical protein